jgi:fructosamine-3-kinase
MKNFIFSVCEETGLKYRSSSPVSGGDINSAFTVDTNQGSFFLKINSASLYPNMFVKEAEGLEALQQAALLRVPAVIAKGERDGRQYLLLEWLEKRQASNNSWVQGAEGLAQLHQLTHPCFGWNSYNYIGSLVQNNNYCETWAEFYATQRVMPLVEKLYNSRLFSKADTDAIHKLCQRFEDIFPEERPALVHGDLWAGNFMAVSSNNPATVNIQPSLFDPAVYYGNREMDIGMSLLFGGFSQTFYDAYNSVFSLAGEWQGRVHLTQYIPCWCMLSYFQAVILIVVVIS